MITDERYNLKPDIIQADQCLKNWLKNEVIDGTAACASISSYVVDDDDSAVT
jgi:hypothetical protein